MFLKQLPNFVSGQGDQIGQIFAHWVIVYFFWKSLKQTTILGYFSHSLRLCINYVKNGLGYILGDFFTNSSGHAVSGMRRKINYLVRHLTYITGWRWMDIFVTDLSIWLCYHLSNLKSSLLTELSLA
jgi:hypothetical protein